MTAIAPWLDLRQGDALTVLRTLADESVNCVVTSPPYWALRDYGVDGQIGLEDTVPEYLAKLVEVFREVHRVLRSDGTLWINMGDGYDAGTRETRDVSATGKHGYWTNPAVNLRAKAGLKPKDLIGTPWLLAFALRDDGWWLRCDIIWSKPNPMPESVTDRPTKAHEYVFLLSKSASYWYDAEAIREAASYAGPNGAQHSPYGQGFTRRSPDEEAARQDKQRGHGRRHSGFNDRWDLMTHAEQAALGRNKRSVWEIATQPYPDAHFATFPADLIKPCILAGCPEGGVVLDPFVGSGTTAQVANQLGRRALGIELNSAYLALARKRCNQVTVWEGSESQ